MFPNTPEVYQMVFSMLQKPVWLIWSCHKNCLSVRMFQGNFGCHESLRWLFRLIGKYQLCFHQKIIGDVLSLYQNFQEAFFLTIIAISRYQNVNNTTSKSQLSYQKTSESLRQTELLSKKFQLFSSFRNFNVIFAPLNSYFTEKSRWVPLKTTTSSSCIYTVLRKCHSQ